MCGLNNTMALKNIYSMNYVLKLAMVGNVKNYTGNKNNSLPKQVRLAVTASSVKCKVWCKV